MPTKAPQPVPEGMNSVTTQLIFNGNCKEAIDFYKKAFNATLLGDVAYGPDGKSIIHSMIKIGDTNLMLMDAMPGGVSTGPKGPVTAGLYMYVSDCDKIFNQAVSAGCTVVHPMMDAFWGDRSGMVRDPFGHVWSVSTFKWVMTPEEIAKGQEEWMKSMPAAK